MNGLWILLFNLSFFSHFSQDVKVLVEGNLGTARPRSISEPVAVHQSQDALQITFDNAGVETLEVRVENNTTSEVVYTYTLNPYQESSLYIPISHWDQGEYTIYFVNPINNLYMYGNFYKE